MFGSGKVGVQGRAPASLRGLTSFIARVGLRAADGETQAPARPADDLGNMRKLGVQNFNDACRQQVWQQAVDKSGRIGRSSRHRESR